MALSREDKIIISLRYQHSLFFASSLYKNDERKIKAPLFYTVAYERKGTEVGLLQLNSSVPPSPQKRIGFDI